ncbi:hypothetical protein PUN4_320008 [Paraburkholderia unamae]|uniref:hypothetical protein n=1 Tax=Paraburkholderia unamae TaxID=219649 RepID=UPI001CB564DF|nr:hypothetical protein [Paraburkholderia unamae]CAG9258498.1 hypothetical protein PUN4_320008 [Paraburkholderia unamae]
MIRFENDLRTRGEQLVLRSILQGCPLARCDWHSLRAQDFAHDLHGRIFRAAERLEVARIWPQPRAVYASMRDEQRTRGRGPALDGVADYLAWLSGNDPCFLVDRAPALIAFVDAIGEQHEAEARAEAMRGRK